jgi:hypothetical protein
MKATLVLLLALLLHLHATCGGVVTNTEKRPTVYLLSIGFSPNKPPVQQDKMYFTPCPVCRTDATGMAQYFQQLNTNRQIADTVISYVYTSDITLDTVFNVFNRLQKSIRPEDIFIFYYASIAWGIQTDESGNPEGYYAFNGNISPATRATYAFTLRHLKMLTDRIAAQRQLIVFDTGMGDVIQPDYYRNFFNENIAEAKFSRKNRIILCPEIMSSESNDERTNTKKGDMFKVISNLPDSFNVLRVFDTANNTTNDRYKTFMKYWYANQVGLRAQISILRESEYLQILSAIKVDNNGDGKRGFTLKSKPPEVDSNIVNRKKKAIIIATNQYSTPSWTTLRNPVNDGKDAEAVFRSLGYDVLPLYNQPRERVLNALSELIENEVQNPYSQYIIYFAGHGYYEPRQKAGYIVCSDSRMKDGVKPTISELSDTYIDYTVLFRNLDQLNKVILITDVCFGGISVNSMLQPHREPADPDAEANKLKNPFKKVLASGVKEVDDFIRLHNGSISKNSPFAAALLEALQNGNTLTFEELYAKLKSNPKLNPTPIESSFGTEKMPNVFMF